MRQVPLIPLTLPPKAKPEWESRLLDHPAVMAQMSEFEDTIARLRRALAVAYQGDSRGRELWQTTQVRIEALGRQVQSLRLGGLAHLGGANLMPK